MDKVGRCRWIGSQVGMLLTKGHYFFAGAISIFAYELVDLFVLAEGFYGGGNNRQYSPRVTRSPLGRDSMTVSM